MRCYSHLHLHLDKIYVTALVEGQVQSTVKLRGRQLEHFRQAWLEAHPVEATHVLVGEDGQPMRLVDGSPKAVCAICAEQMQRYIDDWGDSTARIVPIQGVPWASTSK